MYIFPLGQLLKSLDLNYQFYADDTQIYINSRPGQHVDVVHLSNCITEIKIWMSNNSLKSLNRSKTEFMLLGSPHQLWNAVSLTLSVDGVALEFHSKFVVAEERPPPPPPPPPPHMIIKRFGCTAIHNKALYKCIIHSLIQTKKSWCHLWCHAVIWALCAEYI